MKHNDWMAVWLAQSVSVHNQLKFPIKYSDLSFDSQSFAGMFRGE